MDAFMTIVPMYLMEVNGNDIAISRYEQICTYQPDAEDGCYYECKFIDLLQYANVKEGQEFKGLNNDGDIVITIQFTVLETVE